MEEKLAALHGFRLPTYKRARGQPRHDDPCPTFFVKTPAQRLSTALVKPLQAIWDQQWTAREAELRSQRRGRQTSTAAGTPDASEWTPEQRQAFLALLKTRQQDQIDGKTVCDCDRLLAELFNASQRVPPIDFPYELDLPKMTTAPSSIPHEDCTAEKLILKEEIIERARNLKSRTRVSLFNNTTLMRLFSNFLTHAAADPLIDDKLTHMSPLITKSAKKSLQVGVRDFVADLLAEVECIAEECDSLWRRRKVPAPLSELRAELAKLTRAKRTGLDLQVRRSMAELYERDSFARSVGRETVNAAMKRIGADKLGLRSEYASLYENITDSESVQADSESVQADSSSGSPNCETVQVVASLIVNETNK